jgi:hypothetical protein
MMTYLTILLIGVSALFSSAGTMHSSIVGELRIDNFNNELYVEAVVDKHLLALALIREADCPADEMLEKCGGQYVADHVVMKVNDQVVTFQQQNFQVFKDQVLFSYYLGEMDEGFDSIEVESDYLLDYYEHSVFRVKVGVANTTKSYNLTSLKRKINAILS